MARQHGLTRGESAVVVALGLLILATFLPWVRSGTVLRNSYETARSAERLGLLDGFAGQVAFRLWFAVPLLAAGSLLLFVVGRRLTAGLLAAGAALLVTAAAAVVAASSLSPGAGVPTALAASLLVMGTLATLAWSSRHAVADSRTIEA